MNTTYSYCDATLSHVFNQLKNFKKQGLEKEFEIRIDEITAVSRTSALENFHLFKNLLTQFSKKVSVLFYKGKSRKYDRYDLDIKSTPITSPALATQEYIDKEVEKHLAQQRKQIKWTEIKEENKYLKKHNKRLKQRNSELESKQSNGIKEIINLITTQLPLFQNDADLPSSINGIPMSDLLKMINDRRKKWGDEVFGRAISTALLLGDDEKLLEAAEELLNSNKNHTDE
ncbi:MAG: hypothetical protein Crog4KO_14510 [Crocinitomicaceae bacterium]